MRKCGCGEVFGFNLELVKEDTALRSFIRKNKIGWKRKKINVLNGQRLGSHIKRSAIRIDVLYQLDKAYGYNKHKGSKFHTLYLSDIYSFYSNFLNFCVHTKQNSSNLRQTAIQSVVNKYSFRQSQAPNSGRVMIKIIK